MKNKELGVKATPLTFQSLSIGAAVLGLATNIFTITEALLLVIAVAETLDAGFDYFEAQVE